MSTYDENDTKTYFIIYQKLCIISGNSISDAPKAKMFWSLHDSLITNILG